ncbi:heme ABC transporter ATP-binding protein [Effusibacillus lacus]|uniref:Heme ABC transporter ATP-binding protein n=1 Tax=Effusibacillus lacus TaxID=1348429 RepID=A0A292YJ20_9BACL|nr:ABC transporter ATP-binding protein [Effusibacillus lacus]TCS74597.1 nucleoside ABC transporter ATP-binding protein [Effusibacillus lacus]GAX88470.1 heme ABC transporter ATP-binding protein [Effusibacillus lacus]
MAAVVEMLGITKRFPGIVANDKVNLVVEQGEIHALLGENGAGKSTLMNILFGLYQPDEGIIRIKGQEVKVTDPNMANRLGIGMVHQHFMLVQPFTVTENIVLGSEVKRGPFLDMETAEKKVMELSEKYGLDVDPKAKIEDISVGMQQRVEILKTLYRGADILIFDEPTAVLTPQEIAELMQIMRNLVNEGKSIIFITHKLKEIMAISDRITVIRRGRYIGTVTKADTNPDQLANMMVGREVIFKVEKRPANPGSPVLEIKDIEGMGNRGVRALNKVNLEVHAGEIVGVAGVDGNGQTELIEVLTGLRKATSGTVKINGKDITNQTPRKIAESGVGHIPEDRHKRGLVLDYSVADNLVLNTYYKEPYSKSGILQSQAIAEHARNLIGLFDVRTPSETTLARSLSGGNQQKAIVAREVDRDPDVLIAAQPTRGLDVGAIEFIHKKLVEQRDKGKAVLLFSLELDEIMSLSDRIAVIYEGRIVGIVKPEEVTDHDLGLMMAGGTLEKEKGGTD